jgi:hypothetical protein
MSVWTLATIGSHYTWLFAPGGRTLSRALGLKKLLRNERFPLPLGWLAAGLMDILALCGVVPWWLVGVVTLLALVPTPARVTTEALPPIDVAKLTEGLQGEARIERAHEIVHGALQHAVANMRHETPFLLSAKRG